jgi:hypothetical protein
MGVLTADEAAEAIGIEFNPNRCGFKGGCGPLISVFRKSQDG